MSIVFLQYNYYLQNSIFTIYCAKNGDVFMKTPEQIKGFVAAKLKERALSLNEVSLQLGKNGTYLFQFINRASPRRLGEVERKKLAAILQIDEQELTDLPLNRSNNAVLMNNISNSAKIEMLDVTACCGNGVENLSENSIGEWIMPLQEFRQITFADPQNIKMLKVVGDSMTPTLKAGDWVLVDVSQQTPDVDGMYLLRMATGLAVKRLQIGLNDIQVVSDNKDKYKPIAASVGEIKVVGRVIYTLNAERVG